MHKKEHNTYSFRYKRYFSRRYIKIKDCIGHEYETKSDMMKIFTKGGGLRTVRKWKECELYLKSDFGDFIKTQTEKEASSKRGLKINNEN